MRFAWECSETVTVAVKTHSRLARRVLIKFILPSPSFGQESTNKRRREIREMLATSQKLLSNPQSSEIITILVISPHEDDHQTLQAIFSHRNWRIQKATTYS